MISAGKFNLLFTAQLIIATFSSPIFAQSLSLASDADGVSTLQSVTLNSASCHFDPDLTLTGSQTCGWKATLNNTINGAVFQIRSGALSGPTQLQQNISVSAEDGGSDATFVPAANYQTGATLPNISNSYETLGWIKSNGTARFRIKITVSSKSKHGNGTVSGTLSIIGALAP